jgi:hypothetical protein
MLYVPDAQTVDIDCWPTSGLVTDGAMASSPFRGNPRQVWAWSLEQCLAAALPKRASERTASLHLEVLHARPAHDAVPEGHGAVPSMQP